MYSKTKLERVLELHRGYDLPERERKEGNVPIISSSGYSGLHNDCKCDGENVITGRYGTIGEVFYHEGKCWPLNTALYVSDFKENNPKYVYYLLKYILKMSIDGKDKSTVPGVDRNVLHQMEIPFCQDIKEQKELIRILEKLDERIDLNRKINDNLQQQLCLIYENMMCKAQYGNIEGTFTVASKLIDVVTGKEDANFASPNGKYKFFTCSNDTLNCDEYVFDSSAILIAGNGDFNVKHYSGKFNAYQRTYVLIPDHQYYGLLYFASLYQINSFKSASSGSIVKFITKGDIENIPVFIPNDEHILNELNRLLALQEKNQAENEELSSLRDWLLPMLMNGQASISD